MQMLDHNPTAAFGSRRLTVAALKAQRAIRNCPAGTSTHKWTTFRHVCEAKVALGLSDRALGILNALLSFHSEATLVLGANLVVFPSNRELALRANGLAMSTLRRHLAHLVDAGLVVRRDSPNGKRYARRNHAGDIDCAFGLDLSPLIVRAEELADLAAGVSAARRAAMMLRERITLARRDIAKMIALGVEQGVDADWPTLHHDFRKLLDRPSGLRSHDDLEHVVAELAAMADRIRAVLEQQFDTPVPEKHARAPQLSSGESDDYVPPNPVPSAPELTRATDIPVRLVAEICPDFADFSRDGLRTARDLTDTATLLRPLLGVSPSAWEEACTAMGQGSASVTLALILQRGGAIKNPGGYLRTLARRAAAGKFSFWPMLLSLNASRRKAPGMPPPLPFPVGNA